MFFFISYPIGKYLSEKRNLIGYFPLLRWNEFYQQSENTLDLIFLGSSHAYVSFIPDTFDVKLNCNSFNMGSSSQSLLSSIFILKEIIKTQSPKIVILELNHNSLYQTKEFNNACHNFDNMKFSGNKVEYIWQTCDCKELLEVLFPIYRFNNFKSLLFSNNSPLKSTVNTYTANKTAKLKYEGKGFVKAIRNKQFLHIKKR